MEIHKPKAVHSWREFLNEIGIIVIGVLIALSAEQAVESIRTREEVSAFRETIDHEIGLNLFVYRIRERQFACEEKRVGELKAWLDRARSGADVPALAPQQLYSLSPYRSAWDNRNAQVFNHLPARLRQKYAEFYDELNNNLALMNNEAVRWSQLAPYAEAGPINLADRRAIRPIIGSLTSSNTNIRDDLQVSEKIAGALGLTAVEPDNFPHGDLALALECPSVTPAVAS